MSFKEFKDKFKAAMKKFWWFIWEDESIWSWIVNIILAFVLIKFIVYPGLGMILGSSYPIVAVVSGSMEHDGSFDTWWASSALCSPSACRQEEWYQNYGITKEEFKDFNMKNGFNKGDIIFLKGIKRKVPEIGDTIVFMSPYKNEPIIHRVVKITETDNIKLYQTKGDHNVDSGKYDLNIQQSQVIGKAWFKVPYFGWIKIGFVNFLSLLGLHIS